MHTCMYAFVTICVYRGRFYKITRSRRPYSSKLQLKRCRTARHGRMPAGLGGFPEILLQGLPLHQAPRRLPAPPHACLRRQISVNHHMYTVRYINMYMYICMIYVYVYITHTSSNRNQKRNSCVVVDVQLTEEPIQFDVIEYGITRGDKSQMIQRNVMQHTILPVQH